MELEIFESERNSPVGRLPMYGPVSGEVQPPQLAGKSEQSFLGSS